MSSISQAIQDRNGVPGEARVYGEHNGDIQAILIGEAPGPTEQEAGRPFVGQAGHILDKLCEEAGLGYVYITNACKVFPGRDKNGKIRAPTKAEVAEWLDLLTDELAEIPCDTVILLGASAARLAFPGQWKLGSIVGTSTDWLGKTAYAAWHPARFLYSAGTPGFNKAWNQERRILSRVLSPEPPAYKYQVDPEPHDSGVWFIDCETDSSSDIYTATITEWSRLRDSSDTAQLVMHRQALPPTCDTAVFHNAMFDYPLLVRHNPAWATVTDIHDTMSMAYVLGLDDLSLKGLASQLFGVPVYDWSQRDQCGPEYYNAQDVYLTQRLFYELAPKLPGTAYEIDRQLIPLLTRVTLFGGYHIDKKKLAAIIAEAEEERDELVGVMQDRYPGLNLNSPAQLLQIFPTVDTRRETLEKLGTFDAEMVLQYRRIEKQLSTYLYKYRDRSILRGKWRLTTGTTDYADDNEGGARTGRLSSRDENLTNLAPIIQQCLHAPTGMNLHRADYGQIEVRVAAEISEDPFMLSVMSDSKRDIHAETQDFLRGYGINLNRRDTKAVNFAVLYLGGVNRITQLLRGDEVAASNVYAKLKTLYAGFFDWVANHVVTVERLGYSETMAPYRHRRRFDTLDYQTEKAAANHPIQGTAGYLTKEVSAALGDTPGVCEFVNQIHDEVHHFIDKHDKTQAKRIVEAMTDIGNTRLPKVGVTVESTASRFWNPK